MELDQYQKMKKQMERLRSEAERAKGKEEQLLKQLQDQFGCRTIKEAKDKLVELECEKGKAEKAFDRKLKLFREEWGEKLKEVEE